MFYIDHFDVLLHGIPHTLSSKPCKINFCLWVHTVKNNTGARQWQRRESKGHVFSFLWTVFGKRGRHAYQHYNEYEKISTLDPCIILWQPRVCLILHEIIRLVADVGSCSRTIEQVDWFWQLAYLIPFCLASDCGIFSISDFYNLDRIYLFFSTWKSLKTKAMSAW